MPTSTSMPFPDSEAFRSRLRQCANKLGSANALAKAAGIPQSTIHKYFVNSDPSRHNLIAIARAAQVSVEWLACGTGTPSPDVKLSIENLEEEQAFQQRFDQVLTKNGGINGLAAIAKLHPDRLAHVKAGGELNQRELKALSQYAGVSAEWLLNGNGQPQPKGESPESAPSPDGLNAINRQAFLAFLQETQPSAETWPATPVDRVVLAQRMLSQLPEGPLIPLVMDNDSMEPRLHRGDVLVFSPNPNITQPGIYLVKNDYNRLMVVRAAFKGPKVVYRYENEAYADIGTFEYDSRHAHCIGKLVAHMIAD